LAIPLVDAVDDISARTIEVHRLENEGDRIVRGASASLLEDGIDQMVVIRWKGIFERLEMRSTRAIGPRQAVAMASLLGFAGAFTSLRAAATIGKGSLTHKQSPPPSCSPG
jgi:hypothetical protein